MRFRRAASLPVAVPGLPTHEAPSPDGSAQAPVGQPPVLDGAALDGAVLDDAAIDGAVLDDAVLDLREPERETAVARLFELHHDQLVRLAVLLGAADEAEDVVAEAFYALYRRWSRLRSPDAALPYVRQAVVNQVKMRLRHRRVVERTPEDGPVPCRSAEAEVLVREDQREVLEALALLPRRQREAIVLRYWMDLRETEVAQAMGVSCGAVKTHTSRAMAALTRTLGGEQQ